MLPDYKQSVFSPLKFRHVHIVCLQVTFSGGNGTPTIDTANSSPSLNSSGAVAGGIGISKTGTGAYTVFLPKGQFLHYLGGEFAVPATGGAVLTPTLLTDDNTHNTVSPTTGSVALITQNSAGANTAPADLARLYLTFLVGKP